MSGQPNMSLNFVSLLYRSAELMLTARKYEIYVPNYCVCALLTEYTVLKSTASQPRCQV